MGGSGRETKLFAWGLVALLSMLPYASGRSGGAPASTCTDFTPRHASNTAQTGNSPYTITFSPATFTAGGSPINVTLTSTGPVFKGFLLAAQYEESCVDQSLMPGTFTTLTDTKLTCNNGAVTHTTNTDKSSLAFQWTPPSSSQGHIRFRATFVQSFTTFWVNVRANDVLVDSDVGAGQSVCGSVTQPPAATGTIQKDAECGSTKGCFSDCSGTDCNFLMTWEDGTSDNVLIRMQGKIGNAQNRYIAFGLSNDNEMGDDSVHYCINAPTGVFSSYNDGKSNEQLTPDSKAGLSDISVTFDNGVLTCTFSRTQLQGANGRLFALDKEYTLFWAEGPGSAAGAGFHEEIPLRSPAVASLQDFTVDVTAEAEKFPLIKTHGTLMVLAWIFFASIGIVLARYYKNVWDGQTWLGEKIWFQIHRTCMVLCLLATVIAFIIIFIEVGGYSHIHGEGYKKAHPIIGIIVTCLTVINPIMALFRPHPGTKNRPIFNWLHWAVGQAGYTLAVIAVFFGMEMDKAGAPGYTLYILVAFVVWQALIQILLEIVQCRGRNSGASDKYEMSDMSQGNSRPKSGSAQGGSTSAKQFLLAIHIIVVAAFTITIVAVLNVGEDND